jgi:hypothetical protein
MPDIRTDNQPVTQITVVESDPDKQREALSLMTERARFMARQPGFHLHQRASQPGWPAHHQLPSNGRTAICSSRRIDHRSSGREWRHFDELTCDIDPHLYEVAHVHG